MSKASLSTVKARIKSATINSRIAVFSTEETDADDNPVFDAIFADTVGGQGRIKNDDTLLGVFYGVCEGCGRPSDWHRRLMDAVV